jgi:hypothetical protein
MENRQHPETHFFVQNREKHDKPLKLHRKLFAENRKKVSHLRKIAVTPC